MRPVLPSANQGEQTGKFLRLCDAKPGTPYSSARAGQTSLDIPYLWLSSLSYSTEPRLPAWELTSTQSNPVGESEDANDMLVDDGGKQYQFQSLHVSTTSAVGFGRVEVFSLQ